MDTGAKEIILKYSKIDEFDEHSRVADLEIESLEFVSMLVELEDYYKFELEDEKLDFTLYLTVADIINAYGSKEEG